MGLKRVILSLTYISIAIALSDPNAENSFNPLRLENIDDDVDETAYEIDHSDQATFESERDLAELLRSTSDHQFDPDVRPTRRDQDFWKGLTSGLFKSGDAKRWATFNFVYQLACYQGVKGSLIEKALWVWETYNRYACYCGSGDYHGNFLDATDHCCKIHDLCYVRVQKKYKLKLGCHTYTTPYSVSCCKEQRNTKCTDSGPSAGRELCDCDQAMSKCVAGYQAKRTYNATLVKDRSQCQDKGNRTVTSVWEIANSCKYFSASRAKFATKYGSQGKCPAKKKRIRQRRRWWGKKKDQQHE